MNRDITLVNDSIPSSEENEMYPNLLLATVYFINRISYSQPQAMGRFDNDFEMMESSQQIYNNIISFSQPQGHHAQESQSQFDTVMVKALYASLCFYCNSTVFTMPISILSNGTFRRRVNSILFTIYGCRDL